MAETDGAVSFKSTLQLPQTSFAMRAQLAEREPKQLAQWQADNLWQRICDARRGAAPFVLHDGPPYANGSLHHGHLLNKVLKDIIVKDRTMAGFAVSYRPGWDCHGLPIETQVDKKLGSKKRELSVGAWREECRAWADGFVTSQKQQFIRMGVFGDWQAPYRTMDPAYQADIVRAFAALVEAGLVYRGLRPVHWCTTHRTALAEAEVEYESRRSPSLYAAFRLQTPPNDPAAKALGQGDWFVAIWTTTPWSLPGNVAVMLSPTAPYVALPLAMGHVLVAEALAESFCQAIGAPLPNLANLPRFAATALEGLRYEHPFLPKTGQIVTDACVALDCGTGAVHSAPAHGGEDFAMASRLGLSFPSPVDADGRLNEAAGEFSGMSIQEASPAILATLAASGALLSAPDASIEHRYAHCWRCHRPIITRATEQWFVSMDTPFAGGKTLRERSVSALDDIQWIPARGIERIRGMLAGRPDWCLSRQRNWGVVLPIAYCARCGTSRIDVAAMRRLADAVQQQGAQAWSAERLRAYFGDAPCGQCGHDAYALGEDILDVWFDSGVSWFAVLAGGQADLYLEGSDQHRGWFHSSLLTSVAIAHRPPYKQCLTHGFVVDQAGKKISKSKGNFVDPFVSIDKEGVEIWRLWVASENTQEDVRISPAILKQLGDAYRKIRNTWRYLLGALADFSPEHALCDADALLPLDAWALAEAMQAGAQTRALSASYSFHLASQRLQEFGNTFLSAFYVDVLKDRLYASAKDSPARRSAQTALYVMARDWTLLWAPVLPFTAEEAWQALPKWSTDATSVHVAHYPGEPGDGPAALAQLRQKVTLRHQTLAARYTHARQIRRQVNAALEAQRTAGNIGASSAAAVYVSVPAEQAEAFAALDNKQWAELCIVSKFVWQTAQSQLPSDQVSLRIERAPGQKCQRCWLYREDRTPAPPAAYGDQYVCARCYEVLG